MTATPGIEQSPYANSPAARNGDLPQGRFDPTPGDIGTVRDLGVRVPEPGPHGGAIAHGVSPALRSGLVEPPDGPSRKT